LRDYSEAPRSIFKEYECPKKFLNYMVLMSNIIDTKPYSFEEELYKKVWKDSMVEEYTYIMRNDVWDILTRLEGKKVVSSKWLYKIKCVADSSIEKFKARFLARGFSQKEELDYEKTFSPVAKYDSIRVVIYITSVMKWRIHEMDLKTMFLNKIIEKELYIEKLQGFEVHDRDSCV
jgi:hypothetical protein